MDIQGIMVDYFITDDYNLLNILYLLFICFKSFDYIYSKLNNLQKYINIKYILYQQ